ncbi:DUF3306 domain-containing protein [Polynucleobacter sp. MWH-CaK5]|uniref:DUF3306 domain-containing protein n=1 Tax=Polynucleobacter sp. MWH-CaK5 TaxID=2689107 RepID=UPI001BFE993A|nr:DUF3306 domain-containing protein [Polynucleobacter sp. MWH-CaK5]QWD89300.1 DUF3306 domain-containing protein [Polynucleobacter sp. MWH-CaK5]
MAGFLNRWSKKKLGAEPELSPSELAEKQSLAQDSKGLKDPALGEQSSEKNLEPVAGAAQAQEVAPTLEDVLKLTQDSDFSAYVKPGIDPEVQKAAMEKLFSDPRYNVMDGLDIYIDDYSKPDPIPLEMLKRMNQSKMLGLFKTAEEKLADEEAERIERADYHQRLKVLEDKEAADEKALADANSETDVSPSAINAENSAKSPELTDSQESTEVPVVKAEVKTQTKT